MFFFFFQAEDGIRDLTVTGVQTCALPIFPGALAAIAPLSQVEMQMVAVQRVRLRPHPDAEQLATAAMRRAKECAGALVRAVPALQHRHPPAVGKREAGDVDRIGEAVLAEPRALPAVDRATGISAERLDSLDRAAEQLSRRRLDDVAHPARILPRERA